MTTKEQAHHKWVVDQGDVNLKFHFPLNDHSLVLDAGGYMGGWAAEIHRRYGCDIVIFEPVKEFFDYIGKRFNLNKDVTTYNFGLGKTTRIEEINLCEDSSSIFKTGENKESVSIIDIVEWMGWRDWGPIDLMKINIEGGEYELLERLISSGFINRINHLLIQFHELDRNSEKLMWDLQGRLGATHQPVFQYKFVWEHWRRR